LQGEMQPDLPARLGLIPMGARDGWTSWSCAEPDRIAPELVRLAEEAGCRVRRLETRSADLQQVFLGLTGNALRDE